jgi:hypothetical protein
MRPPIENVGTRTDAATHVAATGNGDAAGASRWAAAIAQTVHMHSDHTWPRADWNAGKDTRTGVERVIGFCTDQQYEGTSNNPKIAVRLARKSLFPHERCFLKSNF